MSGTPFGRRAFASLGLAGWLPGAGTFAQDTDPRRALFTRDVLAAYEQQVIGFDMADVAAVFDAIAKPRLGVGLASGADRAVIATRAAVADLGPLGAHTLLVVAVRPREGRLLEYKQAWNTVCALAGPDACAIYGACDDPGLAAGSLRVSIISG